MNHSHTVPTTDVHAGASMSSYACNADHVSNGKNISSGGANLRHRHSATFTPSLTSTDTETRPDNYTVKVWKRTN